MGSLINISLMHNIVEEIGMKETKKKQAMGINDNKRAKDARRLKDFN